MASGEIRKFLEGSTIHGLVHISTAKSKEAKVAWVAIVVVCFAIAAYIISGSYKDWQQSPVSTTITTHPITELQFPTVTVCPPRGSNTAMNYLLDNIWDDNFTEYERQTLKDIAREVFVEIPNKKHANQMMELLSIENMRSILDEKASLPELDEHNVVTLKFQELGGSYKTPGFGDPEYRGDFYSRNHSLHFVLEVPSEILQDNNLIISVQTEGNWSYRLKGSGFQVYDQELGMIAAEEFCIGEGGHLASVTSKKENSKIYNMTNYTYYWLGGKRSGAKWKWLDGRDWNYQFWRTGTLMSTKQPTNEVGEDCISVSSWYWYDDHCHLKRPYVCLIQSTAAFGKPVTAASGNRTLVVNKESISSESYRGESSSFQFWYNHDPGHRAKISAGFQLSWWTEKRSNQSWKPENSSSESNNQTHLEALSWKPWKPWKPQNAKWSMVNLVQTMHMQNKTGDLRRAVLRQRWSRRIPEQPCLDEMGVNKEIKKIKKELNLDYKEYSQMSDNDIELGLELYSYLHYCQSQVVEAARLSVFFEALLSDQSLMTVVASTVNNIQPRAGDKLQDLTAMNMWFEQLDNRLNFSLGPLLIALSSTKELEMLKELDPPFLKMKTETMKQCMHDNNCEGLFNEIGNIQ